MSLKDVLSPFKEYKSQFREDGPEISVFYSENGEGFFKDEGSRYYEIKLKTEEINIKAGYDDIINFSKPYIDNLIEKYKNYQYNNLTPLYISVDLYLHSKDLIDIFKERPVHLYGKILKTEDNKIHNIHSAFGNHPTEVNQLKINISIDYDVRPQDYDSEDSEDEEDLIPKTTNTINEEVCVVCYAKKPNIIFTDCYHLCVCSNCDEEGEFNKCPLCRVPIKSNKIKI